MGSKKIIRASEIGQYHYCSISWYLQRCGYKPKSKNLEFGQEQHKQVGDTLDYINKGLIKSKIIALLGYIILLISLLIIFFEVISYSIN